MSLTYAIPDLHGRYDLLQAAIETIIAHADGRSATIVALGDYIDRGPDSRQVIQRLRQWSLPGLQLIALKGNHEAMLYDVIHGRAEERWWRDNGGDATLQSYQEPRGLAVDTNEPSTNENVIKEDRAIFEPCVRRGQARSNSADVRIIPHADVHWIGALPLMHVDHHRVYVHAGVDCAVPLDQQATQILLWKRYRANERDAHGRYHIVHGHDGNLTGPILTRNRTNLDCLAWRSGILAVGVFANDQPGGSTEILMIAAPGD